MPDTPVPAATDKPSRFPIVRRLLGYMWPYRWLFVVALVVSAIYAAAAQGRILLLQPLFDNVFVFSGNETLSPEVENALRFDSLVNLILIILAITLVQGPAGFVRQYLGAWVTQRIFVDLQRSLQRHLMRLDMGFYIRHRHGDLLSRMSADLEHVLRAIAFSSEQLIVQVFLLIAGVCVAVWASWKLALICAVVVPVLALILGWLSKKVRYWSRRSHQARGDVMDRLTESLAGVRVIKSFRREQREVERFRDATWSWFQRALTAVRYMTINFSGVDFMYNVLLAVLIFIGGWLVLDGGLTAGFLLVFIGALVSSYDPVRRLTRSVNMYQDSFAAADRVFEILDLDPAVSDAPGAVAHDTFDEGVAFDGVSFSYADAASSAGSLTYDVVDAEGRPLEDDAAKQQMAGLEHFRLDDVTFSAKKGEVIALVGERGSGKSTILDLLLRLYDPVAGAVRIDGVDVKTIRAESMRRLFAVVTQETFLFHTTIAENIAYARPDASREEIRQAAEDANILEFIERQPQGFDTLVGERGTRLSGGERQSIAIARAILANAPILLLDEATSNLDSVSEKRIQAALERLMEHRTVFIVAHRLSTIRHANRIIVMEHGRIAETGTHDELLAADGLYARLYHTQYAHETPGS